MFLLIASWQPIDVDDAAGMWEKNLLGLPNMAWSIQKTAWNFTASVTFDRSRIRHPASYWSFMVTWCIHSQWNDSQLNIWQRCNMASADASVLFNAVWKNGDYLNLSPTCFLPGCYMIEGHCGQDGQFIESISSLYGLKRARFETWPIFGNMSRPSKSGRSREFPFSDKSRSLHT